MDGDEENSRQRKNDAVQHIEAQQGIGVDLVAAQQQEVDLAPHEWHGRGGEPTVMAQNASWSQGSRYPV